MRRARQQVSWPETLALFRESAVLDKSTIDHERVLKYTKKRDLRGRETALVLF